MSESNSRPEDPLLPPIRDEEEGGGGSGGDGDAEAGGSDGGGSGGKSPVKGQNSMKEDELEEKEEKKEGKKREKFKSALERGHWMARRAARKGYEKAKYFVAHQYTLFKQDARRGPKIVRWISIISCFFLLPSIFLDVITLALTLSPAEFLANVYSLLGVLLLLSAEFSRYSSRFGLRSLLHYYLRFVEFSAGRGLLQLFIASFCVSLRHALNLFKLIPGILLLLCGAANLIWGVYAACKLNAMLLRLRDAEGAFEEEEEKEEEKEKEKEGEIEYEGDYGSWEKDEEKGEGKRRKTEKKRKSLMQKLDLMERKFEALDKKGDGKIKREDLKEGIKEMNLMLKEEEIEIIFNSLDKDNNNFIDKDEFERWWLANKGIQLL